MVVVDDHGRLCGMVALADIALNANQKSAVTVAREASEPTVAIEREATTAA